MKLNKQSRFETPILFMIFNREKCAIKVFSAIRRIRPKYLYIASDGARDSIEDESNIVANLRAKIINKIDWPCEYKTLFREKNLGCKVAVSNAITWFFDQESEGIILEDDCLPDPSFFKFCEQMLKKFRHDSRIAMISGNNFHSNSVEESYYFTKYAHIWGWATWKRSWVLYDINLNDWPVVRKFLLNDIFKKSMTRVLWHRNFKKCFYNKIDTWDYQWVYSIWLNSMLCIAPNVNLVKNIGFDFRATHTKNTTIFANVPFKKIKFPLIHPKNILRNSMMDSKEELIELPGVFDALNFFIRKLIR